MTKRLENALQKLNERELEQLTNLAEFLAQRHDMAEPTKMKLNWIGALKDCPEQSGTEAQATATREWIDRMDPKP